MGAEFLGAITEFIFKLRTYTQKQSSSNLFNIPTKCDKAQPIRFLPDVTPPALAMENPLSSKV